MHDGNVDQHDDPETQGVHQQRQRTRDEDLAKSAVRSLHHQRLPASTSCFRALVICTAWDTPIEKIQKRHQNRHRIDPQPQQRQQPQQPDHRQQRHGQRNHREAP